MTEKVSPLWTPKNESIKNSRLMEFIELINRKYELKLCNYDDIYNWSIENIWEFWEEFLFFSKISLNKYYSMVYEKDKAMKDIPKWFVDATLNYTENILRYNDKKIALIEICENVIEQHQNSAFIKNYLLETQKTITYYQLYKDTIEMSAALKNFGVKKGDVVVGNVSNSIFAVKSALAVANIGAVWTCVSPDSQPTAIIMRIKQTQPVVLIISPYVIYNGKKFCQFEKLPQIITQVPTIKAVIADIPYDGVIISNDELIDINIPVYFIDKFLEKYSLTSNAENGEDSHFKTEYFPFDHPLYIMYSSGTTGIPKGIVHSVGGTLIQHLKEHILHNNLNRDSVLFFYTITSWMMWNWMISALYTGCTLILYNGSPFYPKTDIFFDIIEKLKVTIWGCGAAYFQLLESKNISFKDKYQLDSLNCILSTGSVLSSHTFEFIYNSIKSVQIGSISGGTDIISCFMGNNPICDVYSGEIQRPNLGMAIGIYCDNIACKKLHWDTVGDLVCIKPFPSMPIYFVNDTSQHTKYLSSYFSKYQDVWCQGDFCVFHSNTRGITIYGRSDSTLNPNGIRFGSSEIYSIMHYIDGIIDSLVVGQQLTPDSEKCILFIKSTKYLNEEFIACIKSTIRSHLSPKYVPFKIISVKDIPYTQSGKKVEIIIKNIISRKLSYHDALKYAESSLKNPDCLQEYFNFLSDGIL